MAREIYANDIDVVIEWAQQARHIYGFVANDMHNVRLDKKSVITNLKKLKREGKTELEAQVQRDPDTDIHF